MTDLDYWKECIGIAADECDLSMAEEQLSYIADSVSSGHENYGMAFYSPPSSERISDIEDEWKRKYASLQAEFDKYRGNAEAAVKRALRQHYDANISIGEHGEVTRYDGRITQIQ